VNRNDQKGRESEFHSRYNHMKTLIYTSSDNPDKWIVETIDPTMQRNCDMDGVFVEDPDLDVWKYELDRDQIQIVPKGWAFKQFKL
jgi:hypothetical protein